MAQKFIVLEVTRNAQGNLAVYPSAKEQEESASSKYYEILSPAASSNSPVHGGVLMTFDLAKLESKCFVHEPEPEPTPEPEGEPEAEGE